MVYEIIQTVSGPRIFQEGLDKHNDTPGIHHIAYDMNRILFVDRIKQFEKRAFTMSLGGSWRSKNYFAFFETEDVVGTSFETYERPNDWDYPEPEEWFPHPPG
jgi:methylmalonyl-CoA/ethylmalonyl-CoA epimerase